MIKRAIKLILLTLFLSVFLCAFASAISTTVVVHGPPFHHQIVRVIDPKTDAIIMSIYPPGNYDGVSNATFSADVGKVTFVVLDRYNDETKSIDEDFEEYSTGGIIELWISGAMNNSDANIAAAASAGAAASTTSNETTSENSSEISSTSEPEAETTNENDSTGFMTGLFVSIKDKFEMKYLYYVLGIIGAIGVLFVLLVFGKRFMENRDTYIPEPREKPVTTVQKIEDAEMRIQRAQNELDEIKKKELKKTERRLEVLKRLGNVQGKIDRKNAPREEPREAEKEEREEPEFFVGGSNEDAQEERVDEEDSGLP